jgi:predicted alpha/beta-fold hydrolase
MGETSKVEMSDSSADLMDNFRMIVQTFNANQFQPSNFLTANEHYQTIIGSGGLHTKLFGHPSRPFIVSSEIFQTPDEDVFEVEYTDNFESNDSVVIIIHGLESSPRSCLVTNFAEGFLDKGFACVLYGFRGCSGNLPLTNTGYHVGFTADLSLLINILHARHPLKHFYLCGFSLGGNVTLKYLGEEGAEAVKKNIMGAAVTCVPFDPAGAQRKLDSGMSKMIYSRVR